MSCTHGVTCSVSLNWNSPKMIYLHDTILNKGGRKDSVQFHVFSLLCSSRGEGCSLCGLQGAQCMGKLFSRKQSEQGKLHDLTKQTFQGWPGGCLSAHIIEPVYGFLFALYPLLKGPLQWLRYVGMLLHLDKVDFSRHGHDPSNIGYLRRRLSC